MSSQFHAALVRFIDRRRQFIVGDVHVSFEGSRAKTIPVIHHLPRFVRAGQFVHLRGICARSLQIWSGNVHLGTHHPSIINHSLQIQIGVGFHASCGARSRDSARQIKPRRARAQFVVHRHRPVSRIKHVFVHSHKAGNNRVAG